MSWNDRLGQWILKIALFVVVVCCALVVIVAANEPDLLIDYIQEPGNPWVVKILAILLLAIILTNETNSTLLHFVFLALKGHRGTDSGFNRWEQAPAPSGRIGGWPYSWGCIPRLYSPALSGQNVTFSSRTK